MAESFLPQQQDTRTFGAMQTRLLDDLNRPDLGNIVIDYIQDAVRFWSRKPFFFTEIDNRMVPVWSASTMYPLGSCIQNGTTVFVALSPGVNESGTVQPTWPTVVYVRPPGSTYVPPTPGTPGTVVDNQVIWGNVGSYKPNFHTQLMTIPAVNQIIPPIDYMQPYMVQMTTANQRLILEKISFFRLSEWDVITPAPIAAYPRFWAYWQNQIYTWVYPSGFFPVTLNYNCAPMPPQNTTDSNFWTTVAERLIRKSAQASISREVLYDQEAAGLAMQAANEELSHLKAQVVAQQGYTIPAWDW